MAEGTSEHAYDGALDAAVAPAETAAHPRSRYMSRRVIAALVLLALSGVGVANPWNLVVVDRALNHFFAATIIVTVLMLDVLRRGDSHEAERTPAVGRSVLAVLVAYWLVVIWVSATWPAATLGVVTALLLVSALAWNFKRNRCSWPLPVLALRSSFSARFRHCWGVSGT